jgi:hypothetical protein
MGSDRSILSVPSTMIVTGLLGACAVLGYDVAHEPIVAGALVAAALATIVLVLAGVVGLTSIVLATLPWLALLIDFTPALTLTLTSACAALLLVYLTPLRSAIPPVARLGAFIFAAMLVVQAILSTTGGQLIEVSKYFLFPAMVLVVSSATSHYRLTRMRPLLLTSGVAAMALQAIVILLHLGKGGTYYRSGEQLGLSPESPHEIALIGVMVAVACLVSVRDIRWRLAGATVAATPALASGVRSALVALALSLVVLAIKARFTPSAILSVAVVSLAVIFSGTGTIIVTRYSQGQARGEYSSFANAGSKRGAVWTTALTQWGSGKAPSILFGDGLRSVEQIEQRNLNESVTAQSDLVVTIVELGIFGLLGWLLVWLSLMRSHVNSLVLLPLITYALTNGSLEYVGAVVYGIALASACCPLRRTPAHAAQLACGTRGAPLHPL